MSFLKQPFKASTREAIAAFSDGINRKSPQPETNQLLLAERAKCQISLGNYGYAIADLDKAIAFKTEPELHNLKARCLFAVGRHSELVKMFESYPKKAELSPDTEKLYKMSVTECKRQEEEKAKLETAKKLKKAEVHLPMFTIPLESQNYLCY